MFFGCLLRELGWSCSAVRWLQRDLPILHVGKLFPLQHGLGANFTAVFITRGPRCRLTARALFSAETFWKTGSRPPRMKVQRPLCAGPAGSVKTQLKTKEQKRQKNVVSSLFSISEFWWNVGIGFPKRELFGIFCAWSLADEVYVTTF